jgi:hypothetical protein
MATPVIIPVDNSPTRRTATTLDGINYVLVTRWDDRACAWFLDILDDNGAVLIAGRKVVCSWPLNGARTPTVGLPPGLLFAVDTSGAELDPLLDDLGTRVLLCYLGVGE